MVELVGERQGHRRTACRNGRIHRQDPRRGVAAGVTRFAGGSAGHDPKTDREDCESREADTNVIDTSVHPRQVRGMRWMS